MVQKGKSSQIEQTVTLFLCSVDKVEVIVYSDFIIFAKS
jgi:hypothetical protein